jgi:hypothetical protein
MKSIQDKHKARPSGYSFPGPFLYPKNSLDTLPHLRYPMVGGKNMDLSTVMKYVEELLQLKPPARIETQLRGCVLKGLVAHCGRPAILINIHIYEEKENYMASETYVSVRPIFVTLKAGEKISGVF